MGSTDVNTTAKPNCDGDGHGNIAHEVPAAVAADPGDGSGAGSTSNSPQATVSSPLCMASYLMARVWGGRAMCDVLKHPLPTDEPYGEAWDVSSLWEHVSRVVDGAHSGRALTDLWNDHRIDFVGAGVTIDDGFPLLLKWLECRGWLSVQVHPDDRMARDILGEPYGKSEVWVVLEADPTARIYAGLRPGVSRDIFLQHLNAGTLEECLHSFAPRPGDCIALPAGTIHAAGGGLLVAEVQQSSNATFRLFDWNRAGLDGKPRPLQIDLALEAIDWTQGPVNPVQPRSLETHHEGAHGEALVELPAFCLERYILTKPRIAPHSGELTVWMILAGAAALSHPQSGEQREMSRGRTVLVPAAAGKIVWSPIGQVPAALLCIRLTRAARSRS